MPWQIALVYVLLGLSLSYLGRKLWRTLQAKQSGCAGGCGCGSKSGSSTEATQTTLIPVEQLTVRKRQQR